MRKDWMCGKLCGLYNEDEQTCSINLIKNSLSEINIALEMIGGNM
jgi:hypothetical protein